MTKKAPKLVENAPPVELTGTQDIIAKLKTVKDQQGLSIPKIKEMVDATGTYLSVTTLRRVFADGSERENFSYENTIRPIARALLITFGLTSDDPVRRARTETYEAVFRHNQDVIDDLHRQIDELKAAHEERCREYDRRLTFLRNQIELKDQRMDRKDEIIEKLLCKALDIKDE